VLGCHSDHASRHSWNTAPAMPRLPQRTISIHNQNPGERSMTQGQGG
jgi:hypothetical protein